MANLYGDRDEDFLPPNPKGPPLPPPPGGGGGYAFPQAPRNPDYGAHPPNAPNVPGYAGPFQEITPGGEFDFPNGPGGRPQFNFPGVPVFKGHEYNQPTLQDALNEPGYQFRLGQGEEALQNSAAARGVLRTGATLEDVIKYGQDYASSEYQNVYNRSVQNWQLQNQLDLERYAPKYGDYANRFGAEQAAGLAAFQRQWDQYLQQYDEAKFAIGLGYPNAPQFPFFGGGG